MNSSWDALFQNFLGLSLARNSVIELLLVRVRVPLLATHIQVF